MNHRAWDLYHLSINIDKPKGVQGLMRLNELINKGFTTKLVTMDELEIAEEKLQAHERFVDETLLKSDIEHIYYPKSEMFDRVRQTLDPFKKDEGKE